MASKRRIQDTLKLFVTDGCNLSCKYCVPELQSKKSAKRKGLKHTELLRLVRPLIEQGVTNVDFRGGEPLTKKWLYPFLEELIRMAQIKRISLLTNGVVLKDHAGDLQQLGVKELGIHVDSLDFERYMKITRGDHLYRVYAGLQEAERVGIAKIRVYAMILRGLNHKEIIDFALLTKENPYEVVFLEYSPYDADQVGGKSRIDLHYPLARIREQIDNFQKLLPVEGQTGREEFFRFEDGRGIIRFVSPVKAHKCVRCARIVLTTDGFLSPCFLTDKSVDVRPLLAVKEGQEYPGVMEALRKIVRSRPRKIPKLDKPFRNCTQLAFLDE
jgi:cyclic pyranopterin phosphate synthase